MNVMVNYQTVSIDILLQIVFHFSLDVIGEILQKIFVKLIDNHPIKYRKTCRKLGDKDGK